MKTSIIKIAFPIILFSLLLSACSGGAATTVSWPNMTIDEVNGLAYVASGIHVTAIDLSDGSKKWGFPAEPSNKISFYAKPALLGEDQLIVGSYNKVLYLVNRQNGAQEGEFDGATDLYVAGALVTPQGFYAPNSDSSLYSFDLSGAPGWTFPTEHSQWGTPVTDGNLIYLPSMDHRVYAIDPRSGEQVWATDELSGAVAGTPTLSPDGVLYVGTFNNELLALDTKNQGALIWSAPTQGWVWSGPTLDGGNLYFGDLAGAFFALNAADGSLLWKMDPPPTERLGAAPQSIVDKPLVKDGLVYFVTESGKFYALEADSGRPAWPEPKSFEGKFYASPQAAGDLILAPVMAKDCLVVSLDDSGNLRCFYNPNPPK